MPKRIGIALDSSAAHSNNAKLFQWTLKNAASAGDEIVFIHVAPFQAEEPFLPTAGFGPVVSVPLTDAQDQTEENHAIADIKNVAASFVQECDKRGLPYKVLLVRGDPRDELVNACDAENVRLLVIGSRGNGTVKRLLLGSTSTHCLHNCRCPVAVIRNTGEDAA